MTLLEYRIFHTVTQQRSFARAAQILHPREKFEPLAFERWHQVFDPMLARHPGAANRLEIFKAPAEPGGVSRGGLFHPTQILAVVDVAEQVDRLGADRDVVAIDGVAHERRKPR